MDVRTSATFEPARPRIDVPGIVAATVGQRWRLLFHLCKQVAMETNGDSVYGDAEKGGRSRVNWRVIFGDRVLNPLDDVGFCAEMTLQQFRERLYAWTGVSPLCMRLTLGSADGRRVVLEPDALSKEELSLSLARLDARWQLAIATVAVASAVEQGNTTLDDGFGNANSSLGSDERYGYEISEHDYAARADTFRAQKRQLWASRRRQLAETLRIGMRCQLENSQRTGRVAFVGPVPALSEQDDALWVGVVLDTPDGKHDGCAPDGTRYFSCATRHGVFVRPERIRICSDCVGVEVQPSPEPNNDDIPLEV